MKKTQRGITLIALIISIVVLLILAVVTVGTAKESGIIDRAKQAAQQSEIAQIKEAFELKQAEKLLLNKIDGNDNIQISSLDDLDISDNLKEKYRDKLVISGGKLYYDPELVTDDAEREYMEKQGFSALPQSGPSTPDNTDPNPPDPNDSSFKAAVKTAVRNTTKTGDYYNLVTIKNVVKEEYPSTVSTLLLSDYIEDPILFQSFSESEYASNFMSIDSVTILLKNGDEEIVVNPSGNVSDYNGNYVLMHDLDAMNQFGLKRISTGKLEMVSYKGTNPNVVIPSALYDDSGAIIETITKISDSAFVKNSDQPTPISVPTFAGIDNATYNTLSVAQLFTGLGLTHGGPAQISESTDNRVKLRELYELFLSGALGSDTNTTASAMHDENLIPSMFATVDGAEVNFLRKTTGIDIVSVQMPVHEINIGSEAFKNQTTLTSVLFPVGHAPIINATAFSGCTSLTRIDFTNSGATANNIKALDGFETKWGATNAKVYINGEEIK